MTINAWKTSFIGLNKPAKVLSGSVLSVVPASLWPYPNSADDPYWSGSSNPQYYRWEVSFSVEERTHGSNLTRTPFRFNAQDIEVGDFVAGALDGKVLQILSISSKTNSEVVAIVEDRLRYNTFRDPMGLGLFSSNGDVIFFQINELGFPMLDPLPGEAGADFFTNVMSRFQYMNPLTNYLLEKTNHGFEQGDAVCIEDETFALSNSDNISRFIGTVVYPGPGPDQFILRPANGIIDFVPGLPGTVGDYIYPSLDGTGDLTTNDNSRRPIYIKIADAIITSTTGSGIDPTGTNGDVVEINRIPVTLYSTSSSNGTYGVEEAVALINAETPNHKVTAVKVGAATEVVSDIAVQGSAYGIVAGYTPFSASINGVTINFTTTTSGSAAYGDPTVADQNDMVADINAAKITDIVATVVDGSNIKIRNNAGGAITIVNITADANGNNFAGTSSLSSLPEITPANTTTSALRLMRLDGGPLTIRDFAGQFLDTAGVLSGQNGRYALGLNIEQGIRSGGTSVVANITARDALNALVGDNCYVIDAGNGEWATFIYNGTSWTKVSGERSVATDARTLVLDVNLSTTTGTQTIGYITADRTVISVRVLVTTPAAADAEVTVGISSNTSAFSESRDTVLSQIGQYVTNPDYRTTAYTEVVANITRPTPGAGQFTVILTYV
jgi:hypothetical protein